MQPLMLDVQFLQELLHLDAVLAESALRHFQSCVRTTLLLCNGYECQEKVPHTVCLHAYEDLKLGSIIVQLACASVCARLLFG